MEETRHLKRKDKAINNRNIVQYAISCNHLGDFYYQQGKYEKAAGEYTEAADKYRSLDKPLEMARAYRMMGEMYMLLSDFETAKVFINCYLQTVKRLHNKIEEQRAYATLGRVHLLHGQSLTDTACAREKLKQAEKSFLRSLLLIKDLTGQTSKIEQLDMQARCYLNIGVVKEHMENLKESIMYIEKAILISKTQDLFELTHLCYISMSLLYNCKKHDATSALRYINFALDVAKRLPNKVKKICETLIIKAEIYIKVGDFVSAKQILTKAYKKNTPDENDRCTIEKSLRIVVKICKTLDELIITSSDNFIKQKCLYEKLGDNCCHLNNLEKALEYYNKMLDCAKQNGETGKSLVPIYVSLYQTYKDDKQYEKSLEYLWKEFDLNNDEPKEAFATLCEIAEICQLQGKPYNIVQEIYQKARTQALKVENAQNKLEKIVMKHLIKLSLKHGMTSIVEKLEEEARLLGYKLDDNEDSDDDNDGPKTAQQNTPEWDDDVDLENLTDTDASDLDETEKHRPHRLTRGLKTLNIKRNNKGETQLHQACIAGNIELVRRLIENGHVLNVRDHAGWLPLHEACNHGFRDIVELLLDKGAISAINDKGGTSCDGITPLYDACSNGFLDVVELLLERGADANVRTDFGETCINALDKWFDCADLNQNEEGEYSNVRHKLLKQMGICDKTNIQSLPKNDANTSTTHKNFLDDPNVKKKEIDESFSAKENKAIAPFQNLKSKNKNFDSSQNSSVQPKRSAFLSDDEINDDDWLIDDIGPEKKKRRQNSSIHSYSSAFKEVYLSTSIESNSTIATLLNKIENSDSQEKVIYRAAMKPPPKPSMSPARFASSQNSSTEVETMLRLPNAYKKSKYQSSLLDCGFQQIQYPSPTHCEENSRDGTSSYSRTTKASRRNSIALKSPEKDYDAKPASHLFKIKVDHECILVPVERNKLGDFDMGWLAEEAAKRYHNLFGIKPILRIKTIDGFAYEESDPIDLAIQERDLFGGVLKWMKLPLSQCYEEICLQRENSINNDIKKALEQAEKTNELDLSDFWMTTEHSTLIFKLVLHQANITVLNLSHNIVNNGGCYEIGKCLSSLTHLKVLNIATNLISSDGLEKLLLSSGIVENEMLEELNLSQNPLGDSGLSILDKYFKTKRGKALRKLYLSQCDIHDMKGYGLCYKQLTAFDISFNTLTRDSIVTILNNLNSNRLEYLNLSFITDIHKNFDTGALISSFFEDGTCEKFKFVKLNGCNLADVHLYKITQGLRNAIDLNTLDISENIRISSVSLQIVIRGLPQMKMLVARNCKRMVLYEWLKDLKMDQSLLQSMHLTIPKQSVYRVAELNLLRELWYERWGNQIEIKEYGEHVSFDIK